MDESHFYKKESLFQKERNFFAAYIFICVFLSYGLGNIFLGNLAGALFNTNLAIIISGFILLLWNLFQKKFNRKNLITLIGLISIIFFQLSATIIMSSLTIDVTDIGQTAITNLIFIFAFVKSLLVAVLSLTIYFLCIRPRRFKQPKIELSIPPSTGA